MSGDDVSSDALGGFFKENLRTEVGSGVDEGKRGLEAKQVIKHVKEESRLWQEPTLLGLMS